ncbi:MAG: hypothetical protein ACKV2T_07220 [Kofleriaceae bacterium]
MHFEDLCGCFEPDGSDDVVGLYTGARTRYVVDSLLLPTTKAEARLYGTDLDGDRSGFRAPVFAVP